jgi:hypothetical protein
MWLRAVKVADMHLMELSGISGAHQVLILLCMGPPLWSSDAMKGTGSGEQSHLIAKRIVHITSCLGVTMLKKAKS